MSFVALGLRCCAAFSSCRERGSFLVGACRLLTGVASLAAEHKLSACRLQQPQLSGSRAWAQQFWGTGLVALPHVETSRTRVEPWSPVLASRFLSTGSPGKSYFKYF